MGDGARLERVFENLIDNAISFSPDDGLITIAIVRENGALVVRVEDEGPGVPDEARDAIFRRFQSIRPESEAFGTHSGLGLAIARTIVEGHQGRIRSEEHTSELQSLMRISYAVFCLKKKKKKHIIYRTTREKIMRTHIQLREYNNKEGQ